MKQLNQNSSNGAGIEQAKIDIYLSQPEIKMALDMLSLKYNFVVDELAKSILEDELLSNEAADFMIAEFGFDSDKAAELVDKLSENVIEPFYVGDTSDSDISTIDKEEDARLAGAPAGLASRRAKRVVAKPLAVSRDSGQAPKPTKSTGQATIKMKEKPAHYRGTRPASLSIRSVARGKVNWRNFIRPKVLQVGMEELTKASSGDVARVRNYLWQHLGLNKAEEVVVVLSWLATTGELVKLWQDDSRFKGILKKYVGVEYSEEKAEAVMSGKITPALLGLSLQMTLKDKLGLSTQDSAMVGMAIIDQMSNEDKPKYILVAYVDAQDNSFNWNQIQESAQGLQLAM